MQKKKDIFIGHCGITTTFPLTLILQHTKGEKRKMKKEKKLENDRTATKTNRISSQRPTEIEARACEKEPARHVHVSGKALPSLGHLSVIPARAAAEAATSVDGGGFFLDGTRKKTPPPEATGTGTDDAALSTKRDLPEEEEEDTCSKLMVCPPAARERLGFLWRRRAHETTGPGVRVEEEAR